MKYDWRNDAGMVAAELRALTSVHALDRLTAHIEKLERVVKLVKPHRGPQGEPCSCRRCIALRTLHDTEATDA